MNPKMLRYLSFHLLRMNENMIGKAILAPQSKAIERGIFSVPGPRVHVVSRQNNLLPSQLEVKHQQGSIKVLQLVVPKNVEDVRFRRGGIAHESKIERQYCQGSRCKTRFPWGELLEIHKTEPWGITHFRAIQLVASNHLQGNILGYECLGQTHNVRPIYTAGEQCHFDLQRQGRAQDRKASVVGATSDLKAPNSIGAEHTSGVNKLRQRETVDTGHAGLSDIRRFSVRALINS